MDTAKVPAYELIRKEQIEDIQSVGYLLRHKKSGARVMVLENEDENKVFNIAFRTTPANSTGVAHIMEHTVLCGSKHFPAKDPFVELVKGSMNTFLNAMTYPDKTMFPVASCNDKDFANLMHVYLDAVFYPNIYRKEEIFRQEGWNYQLEKPEDEIVYNGVVYNEMKGAFSSPEDVLEREIMNSLFPDTTYGVESGGDPQCIPELTYEEYLDFHRKYYHPSNSYIYLYGNMDVEQRLNWMDQAYLGDFDLQEVDSAVALQAPFGSRRTILRRYPVAAADSEEKKTYLSYNTVIGTSADTRLATSCAVLEYVLLEAPGAPLKEALLEAGIGEDIMSSYDSGIRQPVFSVIAKNAEKADSEAFLRTITDTLTRIADEGLEEKAIRAAINIMEFRFREADYGSYPKGLIYGIDVFDSWLYDDEAPFDYLRQIKDFDFLKEQIGTGYYENLIRQYLVNSSHATLLILEPERGLTARMEEETRRKLSDFKASLSQEQIRQLVEKTAALRAFQETPSTQEELLKIPMLSREDMRRQIRPIKNEFHSFHGVEVIHHPYSTNGIAYLQLLLDASSVARADLPYLSILKSVLGMVSTAHYSYGELSNEINVNTGGITPGISLFPDGREGKRLSACLGIQVRTLYDRIPYCLEMIEEILFTSDLSEEKRLQEITQKLKSRTGTRLNESGSTTAATRCQSYFSAMGQFNDAISGIEFYRVVQDVADHFAQRKDMLTEKLQAILRLLLSEGRLIVSYTGGEEGLVQIEESIANLADRLGIPDEPREPGTELKPYPAMTYERRNEGFKTPAKIQYVARCGDFSAGPYAYHGALRVLKTIMSYEYLWSNIRVVGGAYGCSGSFSRTGEVVFVSYRDPQLRRTNEVFEGVPEYLENFSVEERELTKYVIGTFSEMDAPLNPCALGSRSLTLYLAGITPQQLQRERDQVLDVTREDIRAMAPLVRCALDQNELCVVGNEDKLEEEKELFLHLEAL